MTVYYSKLMDTFAEGKVIRALPHYACVEDWEGVTKEQADLFYRGTTIPNGKRRKVGTLEIEDIPQPSNDELFAEEFKARKAEYDSDIQSLTLAMAGIILKDGPNEADKKAELQALESATTAEYNNDIAALRIKYYG